jgi:hypothetical protein
VWPDRMAVLLWLAARDDVDLMVAIMLRPSRYLIGNRALRRQGGTLRRGLVAWAHLAHTAGGGHGSPQCRSLVSSQCRTPTAASPGGGEHKVHSIGRDADPGSTASQSAREHRQCCPSKTATPLPTHPLMRTPHDQR